MELDMLKSQKGQKKDLSDIIGSGLAQLDLENTFAQQMASPRAFK